MSFADSLLAKFLYALSSIPNCFSIFFCLDVSWYLKWYLSSDSFVTPRFSSVLIILGTVNSPYWTCTAPLSYCECCFLKSVPQTIWTSCFPASAGCVLWIHHFQGMTYPSGIPSPLHLLFLYTSSASLYTISTSPILNSLTMYSFS